MGLAVGQQLAKKGANVAIIARDRGKLLQAIEEIRVCPFVGASRDAQGR